MSAADVKAHLPLGLSHTGPATIVDASRLLSHLKRGHTNGYATSLDAFDEGAFSIAAPIAPCNGAAGYAVGVVGLSQHLLEGFGEKCLAETVRRAARNLTPIIAATAAR